MQDHNASPAQRGPHSVGFIGVGAMGSAFAQRLMEAGWRVTATDVSAASLDQLRGLGAQTAPDASQAVHDLAAVVICVNSSDAYFDALLGPRGVIRGAKPGAVVVDVCTLAEHDKLRARDALAAAGVTLLDCAVSGNRQSVLDGTLSLYASGDPDAFAKVRPLLEAMATDVLHVGSFGMACRLKFVMNHLVCIHTAATAEAMAFSARLGLDADTVLDAVSRSAASSRIWEIRGRMMARRDYRSSRGGFGMLRKDGPLIRDAATAGGGQAPLLELALDLHRQAMDRGYGCVDTAVLYESCRRASGQAALEPQEC